MTVDGDREEHNQLAKERWIAHREQHTAEKDLDVHRWESHADQHDSIARNLAEYKAQSNEWRGSLSDLRLTFASRAEVEALEGTVRQGISDLRGLIGTEREERREQQNLRTGARQGISQTGAILLGLLAVAGTLVGIAGTIVVILNSVVP